MRFRIQQNHTIDLLFPAALFFVFAVSALSVLLMSTRVYQSVVQRSSLNDPARTSLSYISEKLHQSDSDCLASIGSFDGCEALIIKQSYEDSSYFTYIYVYNQELKEQFVREGTSARLLTVSPSPL